MDIAGLVVIGTYSDNTTKIETIMPENITGFDSSALLVGQVLTITVDGKTVTYTITIDPVVVLPLITGYTFNGVAQNIAVNPATNPVKIDFTASEPVEWTSLKIENQSDVSIYKSYSFSYSCDGGLICSQTWDGSISPVGKTLVDGIYKLKVHIISSSDSTKSFYDYIAPYAITVDSIIQPPPAPTLSGIAVTTLATKLTYNIGDALDITGLVVTGAYSDATTKIETIIPENITGFDSSVAITGQVLTITINGQTTTYAIDIVEADPMPPTISSCYPVDNSVDVPVDVQPTLTFSEVLDPVTVKNANIQLREYAALASDAKAVSDAVTLSQDGITVELHLSSPLQYGKQYYFFVGSGVNDIAGNNFTKNTWYHAQRDQHEFTTL